MNLKGEVCEKGEYSQGRGLGNFIIHVNGNKPTFITQQLEEKKNGLAELRVVIPNIIIYDVRPYIFVGLSP